MKSWVEISRRAAGSGNYEALAKSGGCRRNGIARTRGVEGECVWPRCESFVLRRTGSGGVAWGGGCR